MKKINILFMVIFLAGIRMAMACDLCRKNQPAGFENLTHGAGPSGNLDYVITMIAAIIVAIALFLSVKYLVRPRETDPDHIKNIVLKDDF